MLKLWGRATSMNVQKVIWTLGEIGLAYDRIDIGGRFGGLEDRAYQALNPNGRIPTVEDDDVIVWESNAVVRYLCARYSEGGLWDRDPGKRARVDQWMDWMQTTLGPDFFAVFLAAVRTPPARQDQKAISALSRTLAERYRLIDDQLADKPFLTGESLSMADIVIGATLYRYHEMDIERPPLKHLAAWYERLGQRAAYRNSVMTSFEELRAH
jgi:glutathione S-transferase